MQFYDFLTLLSLIITLNLVVPSCEREYYYSGSIVKECYFLCAITHVCFCCCVLFPEKLMFFRRVVDAFCEKIGFYARYKLIEMVKRIHLVLLVNPF